MTFRPDAQLDPSQVEDRRGRGGFGAGGPVIVGGGGIGLIILIASLLLGVDPTGLIDTTYQPPIEGASSVQECRTGADANRRADCRVVGFVDSIQKYWNDEFTRRGTTYTPATTVIFSGYVQAQCGTASAAQGPFYCPLDQKAYLDLTFFDQLESQFGAKGGPFAVGYVIAHEYGHHIQNELGLLRDRSSARESVRVELQADCLAGVWAKNAASTGYLQPPSDAEIAQALDAAAAVGDDRIQQQTQGQVTPETWTHGSSEQRQFWFKAGYASGNMDRCDTSGV
ncbi:MAG TPA: neutral zinc metallopeptidase [Candidatus Limnocylindria bacterium]|nr:neutral zinc metallopeptidase [Candidatus Limnocylindria bacterium]